MGKIYLTYTEVAQELEVHYDTVRAWVARGELPAVYVGARRPRITRAALDEWKAAQIRAYVPRRVSA